MSSSDTIHLYIGAKEAGFIGNQSVSFNISVTRNDHKKIRDAEIRIKPIDSWYLSDQPESGNLLNNSDDFPKLEPNEKYDLFFYPNGRNGKEVKTEFEFVSYNYICPQGCNKDPIVISVFEDSVTFSGNPIEKAYGQTKVNYEL